MTRLTAIMSCFIILSCSGLSSTSKPVQIEQGVIDRIVEYIISDDVGDYFGIPRMFSVDVSDKTIFIPYSIFAGSATQECPRFDEARAVGQLYAAVDSIRISNGDRFPSHFTVEQKDSDSSVTVAVSPLYQNTMSVSVFLDANRAWERAGIQQGPFINYLFVFSPLWHIECVKRIEGSIF